MGQFGVRRRDAGSVVLQLVHPDLGLAASTVHHHQGRESEQTSEGHDDDDHGRLSARPRSFLTDLFTPVRTNSGQMFSQCD